MTPSHDVQPPHDPPEQPDLAGWLPLYLDPRAGRWLIVGGGGVARRRAATLLHAGARVTVIAIEFDDAGDWNALDRIAQARPNASPDDWIRLSRAFQPDDCRGVAFVVAATDSPTVNQDVSRAAAQAGALVNRADDPAAGQFTIPAHGRRGPVAIAVTTGGASAAAAARYRDAMLDSLDEAELTLLEHAAAWRPRIQQAIADPAHRAARLRAMTAPDMLDLLRREGPAAVDLALARLADPAADNPPPATPRP